MKPRIKICCINSIDEATTAIDVCSGVRTSGSLDSHKLDRFIREVLRD
ncbi:MAG TPA: hypothetical protein VMV77_06025 [Bacteroidales bacterium]|nr:hypothetical protein [Bacteroidales bacterium]